MAYDERLAERMRPFLLPRAGVSERPMFGGIAFSINGNLFCGIWKDTLILRLPPEESATLARTTHLRPMDLTGRPMKGWWLVAPAGLEKDAELYGWLERAYAFTETLPRKRQKSPFSE